MKNEFNRNGNGNKLIYSKPELLIPAGGMPQLIAAVENGADAVYLGGNAFNARINADNFDIASMEKAVDFCHLRGVKAYVTLNTLMRDDQLKPAINYAKELYKIGVDALIIQDLGLGQLIKETMPDFEMHLSTQGTVFGVGGANMAESLGYSRVVLAREMSLKEIKRICDKSKIETEVFVHGALCFCFSGQCQLSRSFGGRSGNQGVCAQPCRLPYKLVGRNDPKEEKIPFGDKNPAESRTDFEKKHHLSPKDLSLIDHLDELIKIGVHSLKVEGRLKSPEYVATVTRIYRKYIDEFSQNGSYQISTDDRQDLLQIFNRGNFTDAYLRGDSGDSLMSSSFPKNQGIYIGEVKSIKKIKSIYTFKISADTTKQLSAGDVIEARFHDESGNLQTESTLITYIEYLNLNNKNKNKNKKSEKSTHKQQSAAYGEVVVGDFSKPIPIGAKIYRVISKELCERAQESYKNLSMEAGRYVRTSGLNMKLYANSERVFLEGYIEDYFDREPEKSSAQAFENHSERPFEGTSEGYIEEAPNCGMNQSMKIKPVTVSSTIQGNVAPRESLDKIKNNLGKLGGTPFHLSKLEIESEIPIGIKISEINALRRELASSLEKEIIYSFKRSVPIEYNSLDMRTNSIQSEIDAIGKTSATGKEFATAKASALGKELKIAEEFSVDNPSATDNEPATGAKFATNNEHTTSAKNSIEVYFYSLNDFIASSNPPKNLNIITILPLADILLKELPMQKVQDAVMEKGYQDWIPYISNVSLGRENDIIEDKLTEAVEIAKNKGIYLGNLEWQEVFRDSGCKLYGDFGLNCFNLKTRELLQSIGFLHVEPSSETYDEKNGAYPLMTAEHQIDANVLIDRKNVEMRIINRDFSEQMILTLNGIKWNNFGHSRRFYYSE